MEQKLPLYEELANEIMTKVSQGIYRPGDRLPSIRQFSRLKKVSINTVKEAYFLLEDRRVIDVRPQSGYFIKRRWPEVPHAVKIRKKDINPVKATASELLQMANKNMEKSDLVQLGVVDIESSILPVKKLNSILSRQIRKYDKISVSNFYPIGLERLRVQIAKMYAHIGCDFGPEDVYVTVGCTEGIVLVLQSICKPGSVIAVEMPVFACLIQIMEKLGYKIVGIPADPETGISIETLEYVINNGKIDACILISNFNNTLGSVLPTEKKIRIVEMLSKYNIPVIEDDIYGDLSFSDRRPDVLKSHDRSGNVILCSSFTKTLAPGYRVGWVIPGKYREKFEELKLIMHNCAATPIQLALAEFLESGGYDRYLRKIRKLYASNMEKMADAIGRYFPPNTHVTHPKGGFILWVEMPDGVDSIRLYSEAVEKGITILPGPVFSLNNRFRNCMRLNSANWSERVEYAIKTLGDLVKRQLSDK